MCASLPSLALMQLCLRYYPGAPLALKYVTFHIRDKEKIGVVGRTGSGKTTLLMALFRMFEPAYGSIAIDGADVSKLPLREVRSRLAIIPQVRHSWLRKWNATDVYGENRLVMISQV